MNTAFLLLGSNLGNPKSNIDKALKMIEDEVGKIKKRSSLYKTAPWGFEHKNYFLNQVVIIETKKSPQQLLSEILRIEKDLGRVRNTNEIEARTLDIDILFFNSEIINETNLIIPHPRLHLRKFTLIPLSEIGAGFIHPTFNKTIKMLLEECGDKLNVEKN